MFEYRLRIGIGVGVFVVLAGLGLIAAWSGTSTTSSSTTAQSTTTEWHASSSSSTSTSMAVTTTSFATPPSTLAPLPTTPEPSRSSAAYGAELTEARRRGVPGSNSVLVVYSGCWGRTSESHWGYYNYFDGRTVEEPDGAVIKPGSVCLNPGQASPYSSLVHELAHKFFFENSLWDRMIAGYGNYQLPAECFAKVWGATVFGAGGCPDDQAARMRAEFGW